MKIGEIYFIRERDRKYGDMSSYVKIGMVSDTERGSQQRMSEHQTGNPRDLKLHHVTQTPNPFRVEKFLHQRFGAQRVRNEWFELTDQDLEEAIRVAEQMSEEAFRYLPILIAAKDLADQISGNDKIQASVDAIEWHRKLNSARAALSYCKDLRNAYFSTAHDLTPEEFEAIEEEELILTETYVSSIFDQKGFGAKYPHLLEVFTDTSIKVGGNFTPAKMKVDLSEVDRDLTQFGTGFLEACEDVRSGAREFTELFELHRDLEVFEGAYQWEEEVADAQLRVLCGTAAGIEGLCTWNRKVTEKSKIDKEGLESHHPEEFKEFLQIVVKTRTKTKKRSRKHQ